MGFPRFDIDERDGRYFVRHFSRLGEVKAEQGPFLNRRAAERRLKDLDETATAKNGFARFLDGYISRTGQGQGQ